MKSKETNYEDAVRMLLDADHAWFDAQEFNYVADAGEILNPAPERTEKADEFINAALDMYRMRTLGLDGYHFYFESQEEVNQVVAAALDKWYAEVSEEVL